MSKKKEELGWVAGDEVRALTVGDGRIPIPTGTRSNQLHVDKSLLLPEKTVRHP